MGHRHDDNRALAEPDTAPPPPQLGSLLSTITEAVEQYQQATTDQLVAVQVAAQRSFDARVAELSQLGEWRLQTMQSRLDLAESQLADVDARVGELVAPVLERARRADERTAELAERLATLDQRTAGLVGWADGLDRRLAEVAERQEAILARFADVEAWVERLSGHLTHLIDRADARDADVEARLVALTARGEALRRGDEALTVQVAAILADQAERNERHVAIEAQVDALARQVDGVSADRIRSIDQQLTTTIGEATIARIELERMSQRVAERFDTIQVRVGELESQVAEQMDVSVAVQLERLDELERAVIELDPDTLVRKG